MDIYKNEKILGQEIIEQNRHLVIYGYDENKRTSFFKKLEEIYPIKINRYSPSAIYMEDYYLPNIKVENKTYSQKEIIIATEHLSFSIAYNITKKLCQLEQFNDLEKRMKKLLTKINKMFANNNYANIKDFDELLQILIRFQEFYKNLFITLNNDSDEKMNTNNIAMPFIDVEQYLKYIKEFIQNDSYFALIFENNSNVPNITKRAINNYITCRCNNEISIKVVTEINNWDTYYGLNNIHADYIHDYDIIELDNNVKSLKYR
ncbi:MAG: hypothetical protein PUD59_05375 [bacterium]|nr:hypothetical protein [bacterium]